MIDPLSDRRREGFRLCRRAEGVPAGHERHQEACLAVHDDFGHPAHGARHDRDGAGHRLDVDQPKGLIYRRADEHAGMADYLHERGPRHHLFDPEDPLAALRQLGHLRSHLPFDLGRVGGPHAKHDLGGRVEEPGSFEEVRDALLAGHPPHEEHVGEMRVNVLALEASGLRVREELVGVDAVMDDLHPGGVHRRVHPQDVVAHGPGHCDHRVGALDRCALHPAGQAVTSAELLGLPGPERLEAVRGHHMRHTVEDVRQVPGKVGIPSMAVDQVGGRDISGHAEIGRQRPESRPFPVFS